jgi:DNA processing protein
MNNDLYHLAFSHFLPIGPIRFKRLIDFFGGARKAYEADKNRLSTIIGEHTAENFILFRQTFDPIKKQDELKRKRITVLNQNDKKYPPQLKHISDPPICLYIKGDVEGFNFEKNIFFGIVGTRKPTSYGVQIAKKISSELATLDVIIVSGMAMGIDAVVHRAALDSGGRTIAILGCGVDMAYPSCNRQLYADIIQHNGLVISEVPPGQSVVTGMFVLRNRLISGLSKGILVIEGMKDSGTLITARFAAEQGKDVFAIPSPITSPLSEAPNILLKQGAKLVTNVQDIIEELGLEIKTKTQRVDNLNEVEEKIIEMLEKEPKSADELERQLGISIGELLQTLSILEIKKLVEKNSEGKYQITLG